MYKSMNRRKSGFLAAGLLLAATLAASPALQAQSKASDAGMPKVGDMAPDFTLKYFDGNDRKDVKLSDFRGKKNVIVAFYVFAFTGG
jgi:AhpC/TSA family